MLAFVERDSDGTVIDRVRDMRIASRGSTLRSPQGGYVASHRDEDIMRLAEISVLTPRVQLKV
jgi:hypothetical protein